MCGQRTLGGAASIPGGWHGPVFLRFTLGNGVCSQPCFHFPSTSIQSYFLSFLLWIESKLQSDMNHVFSVPQESFSMTVVCFWFFLFSFGVGYWTLGLAYTRHMLCYWAAQYPLAPLRWSWFCSQTSQSSCLSILSAGITGSCHHTWSMHSLMIFTLWTLSELVVNSQILSLNSLSWAVQ